MLVQHVLAPVEVGETPFYSRMRQIPCLRVVLESALPVVDRFGGFSVGRSLFSSWLAQTRPWGRSSFWIAGEKST